MVNSERQDGEVCAARDAYLRDYKIVVPRDCVAAVDQLEHKHALKYIERLHDAETRPFAKIKLK